MKRIKWDYSEALGIERTDELQEQIKTVSELIEAATEELSIHFNNLLVKSVVRLINMAEVNAYFTGHLHTENGCIASSEHHRMTIDECYK